MILPAKSGIRSAILRFSRRIAKKEVMRKKRRLHKIGTGIRISEDFSGARQTFISMIKSDSRTKSVWTQPTKNLHLFQKESKRHQITNLYKDAIDLHNNLDDRVICFHRQVFAYISLINRPLKIRPPKVHVDDESAFIES